MPACPRPGAAAPAELIIGPLRDILYTYQRHQRWFRVWRGQVVKLAGRVLSILALAALATPVQGQDDFPLVGTYTENQACKPNGSDPGVSRVTITPRDKIGRASCRERVESSGVGESVDKETTRRA